MLFLATTTTKLQVVTSAAGDIGVYASYGDLSGTTVTPNASITRITTAATTDVVAPPAASMVRNVKDLKIGNNSTTVANTVTIQITDGTTTFALQSVTLAPGERLSYVEGVGIRVFDAQGREKQARTGVAKKLSQNQLTAAAVTQYTVPAATTSELKKAVITNTDTVERTVTIHLIPSGGTAGATNRIFDAYAVPAKATVFLDLSGVYMGAGDFIQALASAAAFVNLYIAGEETT